MPRGTVLIGGSTIQAVLRLDRSACLAPMVLAFSAHLGRLTCLAVDEPADVVIGKTLRDTAGEHVFQLEAQTIVLMFRNKMILSLSLLCFEIEQFTGLVTFISQVRTL